MTFDYDLAKRCVDRITSHPGTWDQTNWATRLKGSGSSYCFAGHVVVERGYKIDWEYSRYDTTGRAFSEWCVAHTGRTERIRLVAARELGLGLEKALVLFAHENDRKQLRKLIKEYKEAENFKCLTPISLY